MPIEGDTLRDAAQAFCDHVNRVLCTTVTETRLQVLEVHGTPYIQFAFRQAGRATPAPLRTRFGPMWLYLGQMFDSVAAPTGRRRLRTIQYRYTLTLEGVPESLLRWEYVRTPPAGGVWCRHHLQGPVLLHVYGHVVPLDDLHLPTGYVAFEEVLRFCIVDLGVTPLAADWDRTLRESYERFKTDYTA